jgi:hypothetical protein
MTTSNRTIVLAAGVFLSGLAAHERVVHAADGLAITSRTGGFLTESDRRAPRVVDGSSGGLVDLLCARAGRSSQHGCPAEVNDVQGPSDLTAELPHLRLNIILREMRNVVVLGSGVDSLGPFQEPWATFKIESTAADVSIPAAGDPPYGLPVPAPGDTWSDIPHANGLFQGIIENGCLGPPATFDLTLDSTIHRPSNGEVFGEVHLADTVDGHGYHNFKYTIRARDEAGNVSDFVFSGDADSYCSGQSDLSSGLDGGAVLAVETAKLEPALASYDLQSLHRSDFISQEDIDRAGGRYQLVVPGIGDVYVTGLRAPTADKTCTVHKPSLIKAVAEDPPSLSEPRWLEITIYRCPWGLCCLGPLGGGCYIIVART